ncbi:hypothetical protein AVEN_74529-1 [Araneus ventricosus]|uniref:RING-type E3 ubiquitin transferase n=1 Tax=Araneus ventricosus TaxID=182803 RepID=A0A4Y2GRM6_ARAVE|nr:hypothetical protein AVEN_74529-1 [Araneus ventricosus]
MGRARKKPAKPLVSNKDSPPKRQRGRPQKKKLAPPCQVKVHKCCVCLDATRYRKMKSLPCGHTFHENCINKWLETHEDEECPLCGKSLEQASAESEANESNGNDHTCEPLNFMQRLFLLWILTR